MKINKNEIDIRPESSIYATYQRLSYQPIYAVAEFIDNSTASYFEHKEELHNFYKKNNKDYKLKIYVLYSNQDKKSKISIRDNAFGMEIENFKRAVVLGTPPEKKNGRNEFGMGLKTAATWFSKKWTIKTTQFGSTNEYEVTMDIEDLINNNPQTLPIKTSTAQVNSHYTELILEDLLKFFTSKPQKKKVIRMIAGMYRRDIAAGDIEIIFAEKKDDKWYDFEGNFYEDLQKVPAIKFEPVKPRLIQPGQVPEINEPTLCVGNFDGEFQHDNKTFKVKATVGIRETGSRAEAGFTLFRRNRAIIGGFENNYRPVEIFKDQSGFIYQRLYGEIDVDDFPVNQAKDGFSWDDGLEEAFINFLNQKVGKFQDWAIQLRKSDESGFNKVTESLNNKTNKDVKKMLNAEEVSTIAELKEKKVNKNDEVIDLLCDQKGENSLDTYIKTNNDGLKFSFWHSISNQNDPKEWISIQIIDEAKLLFNITLFVEHKFLKPFTQEPDFILFMKKFSIAYASAILSLRQSSADGRVDPIKITKKINEYLLEDK